MADHVYVASNLQNKVYAYSIASDGTLTSNGTVTTGYRPAWIAMDPAGHYAYSINQCGSDAVCTAGSVHVLEINSDGTLTGIQVIATGVNAMWGAEDQSGHYLYVTNQSNQTISLFTIGSDGKLTATGGLATQPANLDHRWPLNCCPVPPDEGVAGIGSALARRASGRLDPDEARHAAGLAIAAK